METEFIERARKSDKLIVLEWESRVRYRMVLLKQNGTNRHRTATIFIGYKGLGSYEEKQGLFHRVFKKSPGKNSVYIVTKEF